MTLADDVYDTELRENLGLKGCKEIDRQVKLVDEPLIKQIYLCKPGEIEISS